MSAASKKRKRKASEFHSEVTRERIRATLLVERLQEHFFGMIELTMTQIRTAEILLRKVVPDLKHTDLSATSGQRFVIEVPPELTREEWEKPFIPLLSRPAHVLGFVHLRQKFAR